LSICVIFNPTARGEKANRFRRHIDDIGAASSLKLTWAPGTARLLAAEAVREGFTTIVAAGGDGTVNEVLNGIGDVPDGFKQARLGVLPLGTVNVFAKEAGIPGSLRRAWEIIRRGSERVIDLPFAEFTAAGVPQRRYFAQLAGAGLDARAIELIDWPLKKKIGSLAYIVAGFKAWSEELPLITTTTGEVSASGQLVLIGNGRYYGGRFPFFPEADPRDGLLDVCVFREISWGMLALAGWGLLTRRFRNREGVTCFKADRFQLTSTAPAAFELEGDAAGRLPLTCGVEPGRLRIVTP
jgi:YegS/Rv2252/BmrU family lipid kinase